MDQVTGTFKLMSAGIDGFDLTFTQMDAFGGEFVRHGNSTFQAAAEVVEQVLGRALSSGEQTTLSVGNGLVETVSADRLKMYF